MKTLQDYDLLQGRGAEAQARGLVGATWYQSKIDRNTFKTLLKRANARGIRDVLLWYSLILASGAILFMLWGTAWAWLAALLYGSLYCGAADSRWHECSHGTVFKTRWLNIVVYQLASFQVLRRPTAWRWSHARHHTDTLITGRDPEISAKTPTHWLVLLANLLALEHGIREWRKILINAAGRMDAAERTYVPEMEWPKLYREARIWLVIYSLVITWAFWLHSCLPLMLIGLPSFYGAWLYLFFGLTQHAGLPENVTDHRLNCRTVLMNPVFRFLYSNMNYHIEHHMFPLVPYYALPRLHELIVQDCPIPYRSIWQAYREILPTLWRQTQDPRFRRATFFGLSLE